MLKYIYLFDSNNLFIFSNKFLVVIMLQKIRPILRFEAQPFLKLLIILLLTLLIEWIRFIHLIKNNSLICFLFLIKHLELFYIIKKQNFQIFWFIPSILTFKNCPDIEPYIFKFSLFSFLKLSLSLVFW